MKKKLFRLPLDETDSQNFIDIVNLLSSSIVQKEGTNEISIVKIRNWFDHKWLNFSGKGVVPFESRGVLDVDAAVEPIWRESITIPPFNPKRVIWEKSYFMNGQTNSRFLKPLHVSKPSEFNLQNRIKIKSDKGLFVWYSSNSKVNKKGSLMIYITDYGKVKSWYSSLELRGTWKINKTKGVSIEELNNSLGSKA